MKSLINRVKQEHETYSLSQSDFKHGTYIISKPGYYKLTEDIEFNPNPDNDHKPIFPSEKYNKHSYSLGFFAAIVVETEEFCVDLNGYTLEQSKEFRLQQRFYANIELASAPFIPAQGPGDFGKFIKSAKNGCIINGTLGRSSHHGIHGNNNTDIYISDLVIKDFEVAPISLNSANDIEIKKCDIGPNSRDVPVSATYSAGRFMLQFADDLQKNETISDDDKNELYIYAKKLRRKMKRVYEEIMNKGYTKDRLFGLEPVCIHGKKQFIPDGNNYGIVIHTKGVAVNDFAPSSFSGPYNKNIKIKNVKIKELKTKVEEIIAISTKDGITAQVDCAGAVFQIERVLDDDMTYEGNCLSDLQLFCAELSHKYDMKIGKLNIDKNIVNWWREETYLDDVMDNYNYRFICDGDSMFHLNKGMNVIRIDGTKNAIIEDIEIEHIKNYGFLGNIQADGRYKISHKHQHIPGYHGSDTTAIVLACCHDSLIENIKLGKIQSNNGDCTGVRIISASEDIKVKNVKGGKLSCGYYKDCDGWYGKSYSGNTVSYSSRLPNGTPCVRAIHIVNGSDVSKSEIDIEYGESPKYD